MSGNTPKFNPDDNPDLDKLTVIEERIKGAADLPVESQAPEPRRGVSPKKPISPRPSPTEIAYDPDGDGNRHLFGGGMLR